MKFDMRFRNQWNHFSSRLPHNEVMLHTDLGLKDKLSGLGLLAQCYVT